MERNQRYDQGDNAVGRGTRVSAISPEIETRLLNNLSEELKLLGQVRELTLKQSGILAEEDIEAFDSSLDRRQEYIEKINGLHQETNILMQSYVSFSNAPDGRKNDGIESLQTQIHALIAECARINDKNSAVAKEKNEDYVKRIGDLSLKRKSLGKYALGVPNDSELFDKTT